MRRHWKVCSSKSDKEGLRWLCRSVNVHCVQCLLY
jgi:hypothetical protein